MNYNSNIWKVNTFRFLLSLHFFSAVLIPFFTEWGKLNFTTIMLLQSWFAVWVFLLEVPTGTVSDYFGRKTSLILGAITTGIGAITYITMPNLAIFMLAEFLFALGYTLLSGSDNALLYDTLKVIKKEKNSKKLIANLETAQLTGMLIAAPVGSVIAIVFGVQWAMGAMMVPAIIGAILGLTFKEPRLHSDKQTNYLKALFGGVNYLRRHKILRILALDSVLIASMCFFVVWTYQLKLIELGIPIVYFGLMHAAMIVAQIAVTQNFENLERFVGSKKVYLFLSALISGIMFLLLGFSQNLIIALIAILIISGLGMSRRTLYMNYFNKYIESHNRATVLSAINMGQRILIAMTYPIMGLLVDKSLNFAFIFLGIGVLIVSLLFKIEEEHLID